MVSAARVLVVCTANQCRSPLAEFLLRRAVQGNVDWQISSAGTHAESGLPMHPNSARVLISAGVTIGSWRTTRVDDHLLDMSDIVLTATRQHSSYLIGNRPELRGKVFPLRRFGRLAERARQAGSWSPASGDLATLLNSIVGVGVPGADDADDLGDPIGRPYRRFKACARDIQHAISQIVGT